MKVQIYISWLSFEPGFVGVYPSKEAAIQGANTHLLTTYGDLDYASEIQVDEFEIKSAERDDGQH